MKNPEVIWIHKAIMGHDDDPFNNVVSTQRDFVIGERLGAGQIKTSFQKATNVYNEHFEGRGH